jgi:hypothetical protein
VSDLGPKPNGDRIVAKLFGAMLMVVGGLIVLLCGLCSATFLVAAISQAARTPQAQNFSTILAMVLIFGGVPIAVGVAVFLAGRRLYRGRY